MYYYDYFYELVAKASAPGALAVDNVGPHSMDLSWTKPWSDGGSPIKGKF